MDERGVEYDLNDGLDGRDVKYDLRAGFYALTERDTWPLPFNLAYALLFIFDEPNNSGLPWATDRGRFMACSRILCRPVTTIEPGQPELKGNRLAAGLMHMENQSGIAQIYELQGYAIVLNKIVFITRVFEADGGEGFQFNIRFSGDLRLEPRFAARHEADLQRSLLLKALNTIQG